MGKSLALVGLNNSHPFIFGGLINGGVRKKFVRYAPAWTHKLFPDRDWEGEYSENWLFTKAWSRNPRFARNVGEAVKVNELAESLEEAVEGTSSAFVCDMWGEYHKEQALAFLEKGKSVFVDKPLAESVSDARVMIEAARKNGAALSTCSSLRFDPELQRLKKSLSVEIGKPSIITVCCPCYQDLARYTVHGIEVMLEITDGAKIASVRNIGPSQRRHLMLLEFADGTCGVIHSWEGHAYSVTVTAAKGQEVVVLGSWEGFKHMVAAILASFESGEPVVPYDEALEVVRVIEAAVASQAADGKTVELEES
ncbi:MAG TPA: Gfo/Idh/MocA family oxidoreductase [archaeon]|nr:Gfo/Idh/MocA family oxidoreductase [archaeon]